MNKYVCIAEIPDIDSSTYRTPWSGGGVVRSDTETGLDRNEQPQNPSGANLVKRRIGPKAIMACTMRWASRAHRAPTMTHQNFRLLLK